MKKIAKKCLVLSVIIISSALTGCNTEQLSQSYDSNSSTVETFTVTWLNYDGSILEIDNNISYGTMPSYDGFIPTKASDDIYDYEFTGWTPELKPVTKDITYTAVFTSEEITYTIYFDLNGGTSSSYKGPIEVKTFSKDIFFFDCVKEDWQFRGWEYNNEKIFDEKGNQLKNVTLVGNMIFKAIYSQYYGDLNGLIYTICQDELNNKYIEIVKYIGNNIDLVIPETINVDGDTLTVKSISEKAFYNNDTIIYASIPNSVLKIGNNAFSNCINLKEITISENALLTTIGSHAFDGCKLLININLPSTVNEIGTYAFYNCSSLTSIYIPSSVATIGSSAFYNCSNLTIYCETSSRPSGWDSSWNRYCQVVWSSNGQYGENSGFIYGVCTDSEGNPYITITSYTDSSTNVVIPSLINVNGEDIPVKAIASNAFNNNDTITSITIPDSVTTIGSFAFFICPNLATVTFGENSQLTTIREYAFYACPSLTSINIPDSVTTIGDFVFWFCSNLTTVTLGENSQLTTIGINAFRDCSSLTSINIPSSVTTILSRAFSDCSNLTTVTFGENSQLTTIGNSAFYGDSSLTSINIPSSVTSIGNSAFEDCSNLTTVTFGENSQLTKIGEDAFYFCSSLTSINIPDSVTTIGDYVFRHCSNLTTVTIGENSQLTKIGENAFESCSSLTSINIPDSVTTIGKAAFNSCSSLTSINIPDSVTTIGDFVFGYCSNLTIVTIGENSQLTTIGERAFYSCSSLTSIYIPDSVTSIEYIAFLYCSNLTIYCEASLKPSGWKSDWNYSNRPVVWNCTYDEYLDAIV